MDLLNGIIIFAVGAMLFFVAMIVFVFILLGAMKIYKPKGQAKVVDLNDGLDPEELELIRQALVKKQQRDAEAEAKAKLVAASQKLAEVAKS